MGGEGQGAGGGGGGGRKEAKARRYGGEGRDGRLLPPASLERLFPPLADNGEATVAVAVQLRVQLNVFPVSVVVYSFIAAAVAVATQSSTLAIISVLFFSRTVCPVLVSSLLIIEHFIFTRDSKLLKHSNIIKVVRGVQTNKEQEKRNISA